MTVGARDIRDGDTDGTPLLKSNPCFPGDLARMSRDGIKTEGLCKTLWPDPGRL